MKQGSVNLHVLIKFGGSGSLLNCKTSTICSILSENADLASRDLCLTTDKKLVSDLLFFARQST